MRRMTAWIVVAAVAGLAAERWCSPARACAGVGRQGQPVVNADQTVLMVWNAGTNTQHFIRQANFKSAGKDFGFLVPTPSVPELAESGDAAFPYLKKLTEPAVVRQAIQRGDEPKSADKGVRVLSEKDVAGFHATVLEADQGTALAKWLGEQGFDFSPAVAAWAEPYVKQGWKFTALKLAKDQGEGNGASAKALRITFKTDTPLFPYREPESGKNAEELRAFGRTLRMYFVAETQYEGWLDERPFQQTAWSGALTGEQRAELLRLLKLQDSDAPKTAWLTEFEHWWPYKLAAADVVFRPAAAAKELRRNPHVEYYYETAGGGGVVQFGATAFGLMAVVGVFLFVRWRK